MDYNEVIGCITTTTDDVIKIDESMFPIFHLHVVGEEFCETELGTLICACEN